MVGAVCSDLDSFPFEKVSKFFARHIFLVFPQRQSAVLSEVLWKSTVVFVSEGENKDPFGLITSFCHLNLAEILEIQ